MKLKKKMVIIYCINITKTLCEWMIGYDPSFVAKITFLCIYEGKRMRGQPGKEVLE